MKRFLLFLTLVVLSQMISASYSDVPSSEYENDGERLPPSTFKITSDMFPYLTSLFTHEEKVEIPDEWSPVNLSTLNTESNLRDILSFGIQNVIVQGIEDGNLPDANYFIEDVLSIMRQQVVSETNYRFNVVLGDDEGNEIAVNYIVSDESWTGKRKVKEFEFVEDHEPLLDWQLIEGSEPDTDQYLKGISDFGLKVVINQGIKSGQLSNLNYQPSEIYSIKEQFTDGDMNYRFNFKLENDEGGYVTVIFVVHLRYRPSEFIIRSVSSYYFLDIQDGGYEETERESQFGVFFDGGKFDK